MFVPQGNELDAYSGWSHVDGASGQRLSGLPNDIVISPRPQEPSTPRPHISTSSGTGAKIGNAISGASSDVYASPPHSEGEGEGGEPPPSPARLTSRVLRVQQEQLRGLDLHQGPGTMPGADVKRVALAGCVSCF